MKAQDMKAALHCYRMIIAQMQGHIFYCEDDDGILRRWVPPRRPLIDKADGHADDSTKETSK